MKMFIVGRVAFAFVVLFCGLTVDVQATSVSATGVVEQITSTTLRIERPDGSKLNASCTNSEYPTIECNSAIIGKAALGRATCSEGFCAWTCLDVVDNDCNEDPTIVSLYGGIVIGKDLCAGVFYLTLLVGESEIRARCEGDLYNDCDNLTLNSSISAAMSLFCSDAKWFYVAP